jgi:hypothetical protein
MCNYYDQILENGKEKMTGRKSGLYAWDEEPEDEEAVQSDDDALMSSLDDPGVPTGDWMPAQENTAKLEVDDGDEVRPPLLGQFIRLMCIFSIYLHESIRFPSWITEMFIMSVIATRIDISLRG